MARLTLELGEQTVASVEFLRDVTGRTSRVDVVRDALLLYEYLVKEAQKQHNIYVGATRENAEKVAALPLLHATGSRLEAPNSAEYKDTNYRK